MNNVMLLISRCGISRVVDNLVMGRILLLMSIPLINPHKNPIPYILWLIHLK